VVPLGEPFYLTLLYLDTTNFLNKLGSDFFTTPARNPGGPKFDKCKRHSVTSFVTPRGFDASLQHIEMLSIGEDLQRTLYKSQ